MAQGEWPFAHVFRESHESTTLISSCVQIETPAGTLFVLDSTRVFAYLSALSGLVFLAGSVLSLLAPPSVVRPRKPGCEGKVSKRGTDRGSFFCNPQTAQTALICLVQVFLVLIGSSIALASVQSVWRARLPITVWRRKSPVAINNLCLFGVGALVAVTVVRLALLPLPQKCRSKT